MGLADWWLARSEPTADRAKGAAASSVSSVSSSMFAKWPLKRVKSEPRKPQQPFKLAALAAKPSAAPPASPRLHCASQDDRVASPSSSSSSPLSCRLNLRGLSASVTQAKDLLQQVGVSLYPSLVQLTVPCVTKFTKESTVDTAFEPEAEPSPRAPTWVPSETLLQYDAQIHALQTKGLLETRLTSDGCGGVYFLQDASAPDATPLGIFKPRDEEYMAPTNPRGYVKENAVVGETEHPVNKGFRVGNGALRERAAYLLDEAYGNFSGVPVTTVLSLPTVAGGEAKEGSVQAFVDSECSAEDMGPLKFSVPEVHKVGILDVRLFNTDRHAGNILLHKPANGSSSSTYAMTPIDHGFCLPSFRHLDNATFDWLQWPQAQFPFTSEELDHIASLDVTRDAHLLSALGIEAECIATLRICTALLQAGAEEGFSLYEIGSFVQRDGDFSQPSALETVVASAMQSADDDTDVDAVVAEVIHGVEGLLATQPPKKKVRSISCFS